MPARIKISNLVKWELEYYRQECNFTTDELKFFNYRAKDKSMIAAACEMHISCSKADRLSRSIQDKIRRVKPPTK